MSDQRPSDKISTNPIDPLSPARELTSEYPTRDLQPKTQIPISTTDDAVPTQQLPLPEIDGYHIIGILGSGGMGIVYLAMQIRLNRHVAIKMLRHQVEITSDLRERFEDEAEIIAAIQHPHIVQVFDFGEHNGQPYFVMEYVQGVRLDRAILQQPPSIAQVVDWMETISRAVGHAHQAGIVHRDLKPTNILLDPLGQPKVSDFGLAKHLARDLERTQSGMIVGTPQYMSPEQAQSQRELLSPATDVYSLGVMLYEMLTGLLPLRGDTFSQQMYQLHQVEPICPQMLQPSVPRDLNTICMHCLEKEPHRRYVNATELAQDLWRYRNGEPIHAKPPGTRELAWRWAKKHRTKTAIIGISTLAVIAMIGLAFWFTLQIAQKQLEIVTVEGERKRESEAAAAAKELTRKAEELAATQSIFRLITDNREGQLIRTMGWANKLNQRWDNALKKPLPPTVPLAEVRTEVLASLSAIDLVEERRIKIDGVASWLQFHPTLPWLIISDYKAQAYTRCYIYIVNYLTGEPVTTLAFAPDFEFQAREIRQDAVDQLKISPDGRWLAVRCRSKMMHRWDLSKPDMPRSDFSRHAYEEHIAFADDSSAMYSLSKDHILTRWDTQTWTPLDSKDVGDGHWLRFEPKDGQVRVVRQNPRVFEWVQLDGKTLQVLANQPRRIISHPLAHHLRTGDTTLDLLGFRLIVSAPNADGIVIQVREFRAPFAEGAHDTDIYNSLVLNPNHSRVISTAHDQRHLWNMITRQLIVNISAIGFPQGIATTWDAPGNRIAITLKDEVHIYRVVDSGLVTEIPNSEFVNTVAWRPDGMLGLMWDNQAGNSYGKFFRPERVNGRLQVPTIPMHQWPGWISDGIASNRPIYNPVVPGWSSDQPNLSWRSGEFGEKPVWQQQHTPYASYDHAYDARGRYWHCFGDRVTIWDPPTQKMKGEWVNTVSSKVYANGGVNTIAIHQAQVIVGCSDSHITQLDFETYQPRSLYAHSSGIHKLQFSPDGSKLAVVSHKGELFLFDPKTGKASGLIPNAHVGSQLEIAWLDDQHFVTAATDRVMHCWHVNADGSLDRAFSIRLMQAIGQLSISPDRKWLIPVVNQELGYRIWDVEMMLKAFADRGLWPPKDHESQASALRPE